MTALSVSRGASDAEILKACLHWLEVYARRDDVALSALSYKPPHVAQTWTPELLSGLVDLYYPPTPDEPPLQVHLGDLNLADHLAIELVTPNWARYAWGVRALVEFSLPLDGWWSDLTVQFELYEVEERWAFHLMELHGM